MLSEIKAAASNTMTPRFDHRKADRSGAFADMITTIRDSKTASSSTPPSGNRGITYAAIETNLDAWSDQRRIDGAGKEYMDRVDAARTAYLAVARRAESSVGFADPLAFVRTLSTDELQALQTTHSLADPIDTASLTGEGALNLLVPRTMARDIDGDGLTMVGKASTIVFPPGDAPQAVKDAWEKTTEGTDFATRLHLQMSMHLAGNADRAAGGSSNAAEYRALVERAIGSADFNLRFQRSDQMVFATKVLDALKLLRTNLSTTDA